MSKELPRKIPISSEVTLDAVTNAYNLGLDDGKELGYEKGKKDSRDAMRAWRILCVLMIFFMLVLAATNA